MNILSNAIVRLVCIATWIAGIVIANGFWSTLIAFVFPFWAWYLVIEKLLYFTGIL